MDGAGSAWPGFVCRVRWLCETCWLLSPWGFGVGMCWLPPLAPAAPGRWDSLGEQLQLLLCTGTALNSPGLYFTSSFP